MFRFLTRMMLVAALVGGLAAGSLASKAPTASADSADWCWSCFGPAFGTNTPTHK